ncbi:hypothetical protein OE88DRAFT_5141 [Heliocybe sulcata]|uniref:UbiA prenyltransferase n=1 Tax=Heliocybe sulcata TaxID=5364 RepID=A0A5C3NIP9_9AGAM|nr:hypothetical protein OE88DRAFT_5141 [Heliocybe sulcata]
MWPDSLRGGLMIICGGPITTLSIGQRVPNKANKGPLCSAGECKKDCEGRLQKSAANMATLKASRTLIIREFDVFFAFSWRDWSTTLIPGSILAIAAVRSTNLPLPTTIFNYARLVIWLTHFVYLITLSNQVTGVEEDRVNKPDRPIPSGKVTLDGAKVRLAVVAMAFAMMGVTFPDILEETICWVVTVGFLSLTSAGKHWVGKNLVGMTTGTWALLRASWKIMAPIAPTNERHILAIALWAGTFAQVQDIRDTKGDAAVGR